jgi:hypothetical protein
MSASGPALIEASVATDLPATATSFKIPYYLIQGRHDLFAPTQPGLEPPDEAPTNSSPQ